MGNFISSIFGAHELYAPRSRHRRCILVGAVVALSLTGCADDTEPKPNAPLAASHIDDAAWPATSELQRIELQVDEADWEALRYDGRSLSSLFSGCSDPSFEYRSISAQLKIGERNFGRVSVRKKGLVGSLSAYKPSLRVNLAAFTPGQRLFGSKVLVLNNSLQDPSFTHQCMAYAQFESAGVAAPRCGFASVSVNGRALGSYVLLEPIKKPFLRRAFGDDTGALYEGGAGADFQRDRLAGFEDEGNSTESSDILKRVNAALDDSADGLRERLDELIDLPAFFRFWAVEVLVAHWDGYSGDRNNFYVYVNPNSGKLMFIPWGTDGAFEHDHELLPEAGRPQSVYAVARLARRLYELPETREQYRAELRSILQAHWDEAALLHEVDQVAKSIDESDAVAQDAQRDFIRGRRSELQAELDAEAPAWPFPEPQPVSCRPDASSPVSSSFNGQWSELEMVQSSSENQLDIEIDGQHYDYTGAYVGVGPAEDQHGVASMRLFAKEPEGTYLALQLYFAGKDLEPGEIRLHGFETFGIVFRTFDDVHFKTIGFVGDGTIVLKEAGTSPGAQLRGHLDATLVTLQPDQAGALSNL